VAALNIAVKHYGHDNATWRDHGGMATIQQGA
jgi:hypothetical protein